MPALYTEKAVSNGHAILDDELHDISFSVDGSVETALVTGGVDGAAIDLHRGDDAQLDEFLPLVTSGTQGLPVYVGDIDDPTSHREASKRAMTQPWTSSPRPSLRR